MAEITPEVQKYIYLSGYIYDLSQELLLLITCELEEIITIFSPAPAFTPILPEKAWKFAGPPCFFFLLHHSEMCRNKHIKWAGLFKIFFCFLNKYGKIWEDAGGEFKKNTGDKTRKVDRYDNEN